MVKLVKISLDGSIVPPEELIGGGHHEDLVWLALGAFLVHVLVDGFVSRGSFGG